MRVCWLLIALGGAQLAAAGEEVRLSPSPIEIPRRIGPVETDGEMRTFGDPGLGVAYQYSGEGRSRLQEVAPEESGRIRDAALRRRAHRPSQTAAN